MSTYIIDTETTSAEPDCEVIELAWIEYHLAELEPFGPEQLQHRFDQRYIPHGEISIGAVATHHIVWDDLEGCPPSSEARLPDAAEYVIGHNVDFDWRALGEPDVKRIDTEAIARHVFPEADNYKQTTLIYQVLGATPETREMLRGAHSAMTDVENCCRLLQKILEVYPVESIEDLWEFSEACRIPPTMPFGKHQGKPLDKLPNDYVAWLLRKDFVDEYLKKGLEAL